MSIHPLSDDEVSLQVHSRVHESPPEEAARLVTEIGVSLKSLGLNTLPSGPENEVNKFNFSKLSDYL